ncbi:peptide chain release factor N(5)-glutamine methyltransferase [Pseudaminobacter soli (ex Li et al. 2025)]|uniref:Release factor glutamine methyltransferase n=1 Tax=Pseudaminobacter soli (ex Li et al. 2025) TaxID=1295366 RepID=A0A2P7RXJ1_9HYPH|nr:peptide chain release factor N(5)-glutamine methyltransferase [Mesorhizobium soli]PSJ54909.1 peptide chain release factor N(5)-glutamine methyltransferase [Mesorhizobium soli]
MTETGATATPATLAGLLRTVRARLAEAGIGDAGLDARLIVEHFSGTTRTDAIVSPDRELAPPVLAEIEAALSRRLAGEPVHRILGFREFYGLRLFLSPETLEPRPDTETLVDLVLPFVREVAKREGACCILDLGTGTGAIPLALLSQVPQATAIGADVVPGALATARRNAEQLGLSDRFETVESDWFSKISGRFHLIVSNPPYIKNTDIGALQREVRGFDPLLALDGGDDGLDAYRVIAAGTAAYLEVGGRVALEIGFDQRTSVTDIFGVAGFELLAAGNDLAGNDRTLLFQRRIKAL